MMTRFEVGKYYEADDPGLDPIKVVRRTEKSVFVKHPKAPKVFRKAIKTDSMGSEYFWSGWLEYNSRWEADEWWCF